MSETAKIAKPIWGDKLYQARARIALPRLVQQANAGNPIVYSDLAAELKMPNPRNLNYVLGCIGKTLQELSKELDLSIPPIQCLVVNKNTGLPGDGIWWFLEKDSLSGVTNGEYESLSLNEKRNIVGIELDKICNFIYWPKVLERLDLKPITGTGNPAKAIPSGQYGGGEGDMHKALKNYVAKNPSLVGMEIPLEINVEHKLLSGDSLDVSFKNTTNWHAVEVKPSTSDVSDIQRGIYQCVKYAAVMKAEEDAQGSSIQIKATLLLGGNLPSELFKLKNLLGV